MQHLPLQQTEAAYIIIWKQKSTSAALTTKAADGTSLYIDAKPTHAALTIATADDTSLRVDAESKLNISTNRETPKKNKPYWTEHMHSLRNNKTVLWECA